MVEKEGMAHMERNKESNSTEKQLENGSDETPDFSDPEDFEDTIEDEELVGDILKDRPLEAEGLESVIVVDNIPAQVGSERLEKLKGVLRKLFGNFGEICSEFIAVDDEGKTKGYMFVEYKTPEQAAAAVKAANGYKLDRQHTFFVNLFTDFQKYEALPDEWHPPKPQPYIDRGNLRSWLLEPDAKDQFAVLYEGQNKCAVYLNSFPEDILIQERTRWTDSVLVWSPLGTYLATFHEQGIILWGSEKFVKVQQYSHPNVTLIDFSPQETFLVTCDLPDGRKNADSQCIVWDVRTAQKKRVFALEGPSSWPMFSWSFNDKYFARHSGDVISIYETPSCGLLDKKSLKIKGLRGFAWSPGQCIISYWVAEDQNVPARVTLMEIPSKRELRAKNLFNVADCRMHWQKSGDYLCVKVDRYTKIKKEKNEIKYGGMYFNFEVFLVKEKQIPVDSVEIKDTCVTAFAWEPNGSKFAVVHGELPQVCVSFYSIKQGTASIQLLKKLERKPCNHLFWSPAGQFLVLAGIKQMSGTLEFIDTKNDFAVMNTSDHFRASGVEWDPTGRYVVTSVSFWNSPSDNAYWMWSFQGKILKKVSLPQFCQFVWRPRPPSLLTEDDYKELKKNLKKYSQQFDIKDRATMSRASKEVMERRQKLMGEYKEWRDRRLAQYQAMRKKRIELRGGLETDNIDSNIDDLDEEVVEFLVKEEEVVLESRDD